jgi:hypothetical protein
MARTTQETEATAEQRNLLATLVSLCGDVMAEGNKLLSLGRDLIRRAEHETGRAERVPVLMDLGVPKGSVHG